MHNESNNFIPLAQVAIHDPDIQAALIKGTGNGVKKRVAAMTAHGPEHGEHLRQQAAAIKRRALHDLPALLEQAEANMQANGITVLWAADAEEANQHVLDIARRHGAQRITKSKSMVTEETELNKALEGAGLEVVETDLGEYIIQLNDERPSHIIAPVIHKTKESIRDIFVRELGMEPTDDAATMVAFARQKLRDIFISADMGISGANFVIAETGTLGLVMNEGNGRMVTSLPPVHVALVGIEKIAPTVDDYATLTQVLSRSGTGQNLTVYTNIINGPRRDGDADGPEHVYVIFLDNGRSDIYATKYAEALSCLRCGACLNVCPVYQAVGGHAYGGVYAGPIGAVLTPLFMGLDQAQPLPHASSLCGACKQACPVDIDLPAMLLALRHDMVEAGHDDWQWQIGLRGWAFVNSNPGRYELAGKAAALGQKAAGDHLPGPLGEWSRFRDFPAFAPKSFRQLWRDRQKAGAHEQS